jgi:hypothetical protein
MPTADTLSAGPPGVGVDWGPVSRREDEVSTVTEQDPGTSYDDEPAEDDGVLDPSDSLETDDLGADVLDTGIDAGEGYRGATRFGTTLDEERRGESLDQLLAEEEPDVTDDDEWSDEDDPRDDDHTAEPRSGRLVAPDEGAHGDEETNSVATDVGIDGGGAAAEEAAVHLTDEPPFS